MDTKAQNYAKVKTFYDKTHHVSYVKDIPAHVHMAVLVQDSFSYNDGYGENSTSTHTSLNYIWFDDEETLNDWILQEAKSTYKKPYKVIRMSPAEVTLHTTVKISE